MNDDETIPPLPELEITSYTKMLLDQETIDHALRIIYERRPDLYRKLAERIKEFEKDINQDTEPWINDEKVQEFRSFVKDEVANEVNLSNLNAWSCVQAEAERRALLMYGLRTNKTIPKF